MAVGGSPGGGDEACFVHARARKKSVRHLPIGWAPASFVRSFVRENSGIMYYIHHTSRLVAVLPTRHRNVQEPCYGYDGEGKVFGLLPGKHMETRKTRHRSFARRSNVPLNTRLMEYDLVVSPFAITTVNTLRHHSPCIENIDINVKKRG